MAIEESGLAAKGWKVELVYADHLNKVDVGTNIAREWFDQGKADVIVDTLNSGVALAVSQIVKEKNKVFLNSGAATSDLTGKACTPNTIHWTYDTYALANGTGKAMTRAGGDSWYFITADYAFGKALERDTTAVVKANGGQVLGEVYAPLNNADFSSQLLQAQSSKAKVIGLANAGADSANAIKQAAEFGITQSGQKLAALLIFLTDVHALGLHGRAGPEIHRHLLLGPQRRHPRLRRPLFAKSKNHAKPTMVQAGVYSADAALSEGGGRDGLARRRRGGGRQDEGHADRRPGVRQGVYPRGRAENPSGLSVAGEEAGGIEIPLGLRQSGRHHPRRRGVPPAVAERMPAGEEVSDHDKRDAGPLSP